MGDFKPLVSVMMPCYNHEEYVAEAIESILNQTYNNIELIILDNGSTDRSWEIIKKYSGKIDKFIHFDENSIHKSPFELFSQCTGDFVALATSDDIWDTKKLEKQMQLLTERTEVKACFTWTNMIDEASNTIVGGEYNVFRKENRSRYEWLHELLTKSNCFCFPSAVVEKNIYDSIMKKVFPFYQLGDMHSWLELLLEHEIYVIEEPLVRYRWHLAGNNCNSSALSSESKVRTNNEQAIIIEKIITKMDKDTFIKVFGTEFRNSESSSEEEILCEKFFWLKLKAENFLTLQDRVIDFYFRNNRHWGKKGDTFSEILKTQYGYTVDDFRDYCAFHGSGNMALTIDKDRADKEMFDECMRVALKYMCSDLNVEERKFFYRREIFSRLSESEKDLVKTEIRFFQKIFDYIESLDDAKLVSSYQNIAKTGKEIDKALKVTWKRFLCWDVDLDYKAWELHKEFAQMSDITLDEFCNRLIPLWVRFYQVLWEYGRE